MKLEVVEVNEKNIEEEHICCAFSDKKAVEGYQAKKEYLTGKFGEGYKFLKHNERGKVFIEHEDAEKSLMPVDAPGYRLINCFWVSGRFKGNGLGKALLERAEKDAKDSNGLIIVTGGKKRPFMSDTKFFKLQGYEKADEAPPYFELWHKNFKSDATTPKFADSIEKTECPKKQGMFVYYSNACPFTEHYVKTVLKDFCNTHKIPFETMKINNKDDSAKLPVPWIIYSMFYNGTFITHEIKSEKGLEKLRDKELINM